MTILLICLAAAVGWFTYTTYKWYKAEEKAQAVKNSAMLLAHAAEQILEENKALRGLVEALVEEAGVPQGGPPRGDMN